MDNGPGITSLSVEEIWLPGQTSTPGGTGLGLTIVKDSVVDLGGHVHAIAKGPTGGCRDSCRTAANGSGAMSQQSGE